MSLFSKVKNLFIQKHVGIQHAEATQDNLHQVDTSELAGMTNQQGNHHETKPRDIEVANEDTIDLKELVLSFYRKRTLFAGVVGMCVVVGFVLSLMHHNIFLFSQEIKLGGYYYDSQFIPLQKKKRISFLINELYVPAAVREVNKKFNISLGEGSFRLSPVKNNEYLFLSYSGSEQYRAAYEGIFRRVLAQLNAEESEQLRIARTVFENNIFKEKAQINTEKDLSSMLKSEIKSLENNIIAINGQVPHVSREILQGKQKELGKVAGENGGIDSALLLSSLVKQPQEPLHKSKLTVIDRVYGSLKERVTYAAKINRFNGALKTVRKSVFVSPIWRTSHFWGTTRSKLLLMSFFMGLALGFVVVLLAGIKDWLLSSRRKTQIV